MPEHLTISLYLDDHHAAVLASLVRAVNAGLPEGFGITKEQYLFGMLPTWIAAEHQAETARQHAAQQERDPNG
jgi:hypothetical protein